MTTAIERLRAICAVQWTDSRDAMLLTKADALDAARAALAEVDALRADRDRLAARVAELEAASRALTDLHRVVGDTECCPPPLSAAYHQACQRMRDAGLEPDLRAVAKPKPETDANPCPVDPLPIGDITIREWADGVSGQNERNERESMRRALAWLTQQVAAMREGR